MLILRKMEKFFPPTFFDVMVHLAIHLLHEAMLGGPVQYRWMYPIKRLFGILKGLVTNRAYPKSSISEAYIVKECLTFCSMYLNDMEIAFNRPERNVDGGICGTELAVFAQSVRPFGLMKRASNVTLEEKDLAHWFILNNSSELEQYLAGRTIKSDPNFTSIDVRSRWYENDPFVLPFQVKQVFYVNDTKFGDYWKVVKRIQHQGIWDIPEGDGSKPNDTPSEAFQQNETTNAVPFVVDDLVEIQFTRDDVEPEIISSIVVLQSQNQQRSSSLPEKDEDESMGEPSDDEENELPDESDSDIDPDVEP
ncbi:hypothetical protein Vadar_008177 [Vaccinium darrowii]|uniref:Uncharacterized protein n=1 Tax=Vaccinium darrowii TaxID=229202 RepID=A0ACB7ZJA2_9ERIC|nr:hypothetical protein Vadar_008177 [Vaccinium darrowii]